MSNEKDLNAKAFFTEWLERLQQESWQLELLISGFALFGIYESRHLLVDLEMFNRVHDSDIFPGMLLYGLHFLLGTGWKIFFINLLVHVILRALWIGAIGLRYVSGEIDYDELDYSDFYTNYLRRNIGTYDDFIERLERICSVLFSYTFLLFLLSLSGIFFMFVLIFPFFMVDVFNLDFLKPLAGIWVLVLLLFGGVVFIDFITMGAIKKIEDKTVSKIYFPIYYFFGLITLTFLYRPLIYNFVDHPYTRRLFFLSVPYMLILFLHGQMFSSNDYPHFPDEERAISEGLMVGDHFYDDLYLEKIQYYSEEEQKAISLKEASVRLKQFTVTEDYLSLFIKLSAKDYNILKEQNGIEPYFEQGFNFSLFSDGVNDKFEHAGISKNKEYLEIKDSLKYLRKEIRKKGHTEMEKEDLQKAQIELRKKRKALVNLLENDKESRSKASRKILLDRMSELVRLKINKKEQSPSNYYFYLHPKDNAKGILMHIPLDSLISDGMNELEIERDYFNIKMVDSVETETYALPFLRKTNN